LKLNFKNVSEASQFLILIKTRAIVERFEVTASFFQTVSAFFAYNCGLGLKSLGRKSLHKKQRKIRIGFGCKFELIPMYYRRQSKIYIESVNAFAFQYNYV